MSSFENGDIEKATKQLDMLNDVILRSLPRAAQAGAGELKAEAIRRVPVRTGKLRNGFADRPAKTSEKIAHNSAGHVVFNTVFYAAPVEFGRYKRPYMRPAVQAADSAITSAMETVVKRETDKVL